MVAGETVANTVVRNAGKDIVHTGGEICLQAQCGVRLTHQRLQSAILLTGQGGGDSHVVGMGWAASRASVLSLQMSTGVAWTRSYASLPSMFLGHLFLSFLSPFSLILGHLGCFRPFSAILGQCRPFQGHAGHYSSYSAT